MQIAVLANDEQWKELVEGLDENIFIRLSSLQDTSNATAYLLLEEGHGSAELLQKPVLINSVIQTLSSLGTGENVCRINGWNGFLKRTTWEVAGKITPELKQVFTTLNKQHIEVADEPGLVAARSISMIVNEAYFALEEEVSTKEEIDIAMKLGTNYPMGPFEWAQKIGLQNIYNLLSELAQSDTRYQPSALLVKEATA